MFSLTLPQINFILLSKCRLLLPTLQHRQSRRFSRSPGFRRCILERFFYFRPLIPKPALPGGLFLCVHQFIDRNAKIVGYLFSIFDLRQCPIFPTCHSRTLEPKQLVTFPCLGRLGIKQASYWRWNACRPLRDLLFDKSTLCEGTLRPWLCLLAAWAGLIAK